MPVGAIVKSAAPQLPRLAGLFQNYLRPAARFVAANPIRTLAGVGATRGFLDEGLAGVPGGAIQGGLMGWGLGSPLKAGFGGGVTQRLAGLGMNPGLAKNLVSVAPAALAVGATYGTTGSGNPIRGAGVGGTNNLMQSGAGIIGYNAVTGEPIVGPAVPPGMGGYGGTPPIGGNPIDVLTPAGAASAQRLTTLKNAQTMASALNAYMPTVRKFSEQAKKDEMERQMAAAGIRQNIATNATMLQNAQLAGLNMGQTGAQQVGAALTGAYNYS